MANFNDLVNFIFYVDPETELVDGVYSFSPFGMGVRQDSDWVSTDRKRSKIDEKIGHRFYILDWDKVEMPAEDAEDFDPEILQMYDKGGLTEDTIKEYAILAYDGTDLSEETEEVESA
jgi:hypothetical protein